MRFAIGLAVALLPAVAATGYRAMAEEPSPTLGMIYWVGSGRLARASANGTHVEVLVSGLEGPDGVALDLLGNRVYWTNMARGPNGSIQRANLDGTPVEGDEKYLIQPGSLNTGKEIELDLVEGKVYWSDRDGKRIQRANLDGTDLETLISAFKRPGVEVIALENPVGMALDVEQRRLYFTDRFMGMVFRAGMDIPEGETHATRTDVEILVTGDRDENRPIDIDLDLQQGKMYWTDRGSHKVLRADLDGSEMETLIDNSMVHIKDPIGISLELATGRMYWSDMSVGVIHRANLDGSDIEVIVPKGSIRPLGVEHKVIEPDRGPVSGGQVVGILGSNFTPGRTKVMFGDREALGVDVVSSSLLIARVPAGATGSVDLSVSTPAGDASAANVYRYVRE